jgi:hypothetical protein
MAVSRRTVRRVAARTDVPDVFKIKLEIALKMIERNRYRGGSGEGVW